MYGTCTSWSLDSRQLYRLGTAAATADTCQQHTDHHSYHTQCQERKAHKGMQLTQDALYSVFLLHTLAFATVDAGLDSSGQLQSLHNTSGCKQCKYDGISGV